MANILLSVLLILQLPCGGSSPKILDATIQPFTGGRELSGNGRIITVLIRPQKRSDVLQVDSLIYLGHPYPVSLRHPESGDPRSRFGRRDTLMFRVTATLHPGLPIKKEQTATLCYTLRGKKHTMIITSFRILKEQIRREP